MHFLNHLRCILASARLMFRGGHLSGSSKAAISLRRLLSTLSAGGGMDDILLIETPKVSLRVASMNGITTLIVLAPIDRARLLVHLSGRCQGAMPTALRRHVEAVGIVKHVHPKAVGIAPHTRRGTT